MQADLTSAEQVITDQDQIMAMTTKAEQNGVALLARQQPVAGELRTIVSSIQAVADVERMGALAVHVAKTARRRHPQHVLSEEVNGCFAEMGRVAVELGNSAQEVLRTRDPEKAAGIREQDDAMDDLHRQLFTVLKHATGKRSTWEANGQESDRGDYGHTSSTVVTFCAIWRRG